MCEMSNIFAKYRKVGQEEVRRLINSRLRHHKEPIPWCQTWSFRSARNVLQSQGDVAESSPTQAWWRYRKSLSEIGWTEEQIQIIQYDELALEDHSYIATKGERNRNEKSWVLMLNKEGAQGPMHQRLDFVETKQEMKRLHDEHVKETSEGSTPIHTVQRSRQRRSQQFEGLENMIIKSILEKDGSLILQRYGETCGIEHLRLHLTGSSTMIGSQTKVGILGDPHPGVICKFRDALTLA